MENKLHHAELDSSKEIETVNNQKMIMEQKFTEEMSGYKVRSFPGPPLLNYDRVLVCV